MKKTKLLIPLFLTTLLFGACAPFKGKSPLNPNADPANLYAFQAATSIGLVGNAMDSPAVKMARNANEMATALEEEIKSYLPAVEAALTGMDAITNSTEEKSDKEEYSTKLTISYKDIAMKDTTFVMYYNEIFEDEEQVELDLDNEEEENTETEENVESESKEDQEQESKIEGIIVVGDQTYPMHGEKELEVDEYEVTFTYNVDETTTITVEQEIENGEQEFEYKIESNGETIYEYSIELEENEVELEIKEAGKVENTIEFEVEEKDGEKLLIAKIKDGSNKTKLVFKKVVLEDGSETYEIVK